MRARPCTNASRLSVRSGNVNTAVRSTSSSSTGAGAFPVRLVSAHVTLRPASVPSPRQARSAKACATSDGDSSRHPASEKRDAPA